MPEASDQDDTRTPSTFGEMIGLIDSVHSKTLGRSAQLLDKVARDRERIVRPPAQEEDDDDDGLSVGIAIAKLPNLLGVRVNITQRDAHVLLNSDISMEYTWSHPVTYEDDPFVDFIVHEGIPRALTTAAAILSDTAASVGRTVENPSVNMQQQLIEHFLQTYKDRVAKQAKQ
jgi:hypothetical protein